MNWNKHIKHSLPNTLILDTPTSSSLCFQHASPSSNVYLLNSSTRAFTYNGLFSEALSLYFQIQRIKFQLHSYTCSSIFNACAELLDFEMAYSVHDSLLEMGFGYNSHIGNTLIEKCFRFNDCIRRITCLKKCLWDILFLGLQFVLFCWIGFAFLKYCHQETLKNL